MKCIATAKIPYVLSILVLLLLPAACQTAGTSQAPDPPPQPYASARPGPVPSVRLRSGDTIQIKFAYAPQFDQIETVRPDGKIDLQLVGEVFVAGKTPSELGDELMKLYAVQLKHPQLAVIVTGMTERRVYVAGQVKRPGPVPMPGEMTAIEAIIHAGGFNRETAEKRKVIIVRNIDGHMVTRTLDLKEALNSPKTAPFYLQPQDIVYVPSTRIANTDLWVQQHLWQMLPPLGIGTSVY